MQAFSLIMAFTVGNFVYQTMLPTPDFSVASERSFFQAIAIILYAFITRAQ